MQDRTTDGRVYRMLVVVDKFTRECLTIRVARKLSSWEVIEALADLYLSRGLPTYIRSDNGPEFTAKAVRVLTERWRWQYNHVRPHQALGYRPPAPEARDWPLAASREDKQPAIH